MQVVRPRTEPSCTSSLPDPYRSERALTSPAAAARVQMGPFTDTILGEIGDLLSLAPSSATLLNREDQLYLFETVAVLIISASADNKVRAEGRTRGRRWDVW